MIALILFRFGQEVGMSTFIICASLFLLLLCALGPSLSAGGGAPNYQRLLESYAQKATFNARADDELEEYSQLIWADDAQVLPTLLAGLSSSKARVRRAAACVLWHHPDPTAVPKLLDLLRDPDAGVRAEVASALARISSPETLEPLVVLLSDPSAEVRSAVVSGLHFFGVPAYEPLIRALKDENPVVRLDAVRSLDFLGDPRAAGPLTALLADADKMVREETVSALNKFGAVETLLGALPTADAKLRVALLNKLAGHDDPRVEEALRTGCHDADAAVRAEAVSRLPWKSTGALDIVYVALQDPEPPVRQSALYRLSHRLLDQETVEHLLPLLRDADADIRERTARRLADYLHPKLIPQMLARLAEPDCPAGVREALVAERELRVIPALIALLADWREDEGYSQESMEADRAIDLLPRLGEPAMESLLAALQSQDARLRAGAAWALGQFDDLRVLPALFAALQDPEKRVRLAVLRALTVQGDARCYDAVLPLLSDKDADIRCAAAGALLFCQDTRLLAPLKKMLSSRDPREREVAAETLATLADPQAMPLLTSALRDRDEGVRKAAIEACACRSRDGRTLEATLDAAAGTYLGSDDQIAEWLKSCPPDVARPVLLRLVKANDAPRRALAARALASFPAPGVTAELVGVLTDPDETVRYAAQNALEKLADPAMLPGLVKLLDHPFYTGTDRQEGLIDLLGYTGTGGADILLKLQAAEKSFGPHDSLINALQRTGDPRTVEAIARELRDPFPENPRYAAEALGELGDPRAVPPLIEALESDEEYVWATAAEALGKLKAREAVEPLCRMLNEGKRSSYIVNALKEIGDPRAIDALLPLLDAPPETLTSTRAGAVTAAVEALQQFGAPRAATPMPALLKRCLYDAGVDGLCTKLIQALAAPPTEAARNEAKAFLQAEHTPRAEELLRRFEPGYEAEELLATLRFIPEEPWGTAETGQALRRIRDGK